MKTFRNAPTDSRALTFPKPLIPGRRTLAHMAGGLLLVLLCQTAMSETKVVGYMPGYKNLVTTVDGTDLDKLTHINIAFINPDENGAVTSGGDPVCMPGASGADIHYLVDQAHQAGVKVLASLGGGIIPACSGDWELLLQPENRQQIVDNLLQLVEDFNLDGIDVDIEGVLLTDIDNAGNYTPFIEALAHALQPEGKLVTAATASYHGGMVPIASLAYFDFVTIMSYDAIGPSWGVSGSEHSTYAQAVAHINLWKSRGLTQDKLVLGVPFYGWGFGSYAGDYSFQQILDQFGTSAAHQDVVGDLCAGCSYITYNGIDTIQAKTALALQEGAGVMIWEMAQDATGEYSLLAAIDQVIADPDSYNSSSGGSSSSGGASSSGGTSSSSSSSSSGGHFGLIWTLLIGAIFFAARWSRRRSIRRR